MLLARPTFLRHTCLMGGLVAGLSLAQSGCYFTDEGVDPPSKVAGDPTSGPIFYYPTGLAVSPGRNTLYVANSDFDLQYNGGTVQTIDLGDLRFVLQNILDGLQKGQAVETLCPTIPKQLGKGTTCPSVLRPWDCLQPETNQILTPAACTPITPAFRGSATIGAFASGLRLLVNPDRKAGGARLFAPVRGDPSITWFNVADDSTPESLAGGSPFTLDCGQCHIDDAPCTADKDCCSHKCIIKDPTVMPPQGVCEAQPTEDTSDARRCHDGWRIGLDPYDNFRDETLPVEPVGLDADDRAHALVSAHQLAGNFAVGLTTQSFDNKRPSFQFSLDTNVGSGPTEVAHIPRPAIVGLLEDHAHDSTKVPDPGCWDLTPPNYQPGFMVTYNATPEVDLFRVDFDSLSAPPRPFLTRAGQAAITVNADGKDSRGIAIDPSARKACEASCMVNACACGDASCPEPSQAALACLRACVTTPLDLYIANRAPPTLLTGHVQTVLVDSDDGVGSAYDVAVINGAVPLSNGASKVAVGKVIGLDGQFHSRVFAVTFDSRLIFEYDPVAQRVDNTIFTGRGPHAIAFDACLDDCGQGEQPHAFMIVGHFTDSYLGVVDLDMRHLETFGTMFASIGTPTEPRESK